MTILKELLYTISSLPQIVNVSSTNTTNENIDAKKLEKLLDFVNTQEDTINKIVNGKGFYQKRFDALTLEEKKNFFKEVIRSSATTDEQKNIIEEKLKDDNFVNEHLNSFFDSTIQNIIKAKSEENRNKKQLKNDLKEKKRLETDPGHYINDSSEVSSEKIYAELKQMERVLSEYENILKPLLDKIKILENISIKLNMIQISLCASIVALSIASFFCPPIATAIAPLTIASVAVGFFQAHLNGYKSEIKESYKKTKRFIKALEEVLNGYEAIVIEQLFSFMLKGLDHFYGTKFDNYFSIVMGIWNGAQNIKSAIASNNEIIRIDELNKKMHDVSKGFISRWINFRKKVVFVVVEETRQHGDYNEGGYGGQNILFKNLEENKIYTLNDMLALSNQYLLMHRMIKVHDKNKGWYIRTLPNNIKEDNLG